MNTRTVPSQFDWPLLYAVAALSVFGLLMLFSIGMGEQEQALAQVFKRLVHLALAVIAGVVAYSIPVFWWRTRGMRYLCLLGCVALLVLTLVLGVERNGATRWIYAFGQTIQPTELARIAFVLSVASFCAQYQTEIRFAGYKLWPGACVLGGILLLLWMQPDHGSMLLFATTAMTVLFLSGMKLRIMLICAVIAAVVVLLGMELFDSYVETRIASWWASLQDPKQLGYQARQALYAHGMGGWFGVGIGQGIQKFFLPEAHTDFIISGVVEELGALGGAVLIFLLFALVVRIFLAGRRSEIANDKVGGYICYGIATMLSLQLTLNLGGNLALLPIKGFTLPLISHGGSSLLFMGLALGLVLRIDRTARYTRGLGR